MALQPGLLAPNSEFLPPSRALVVVSGLIHGASRKKGASGGTGVKGQDLEHLRLFFFLQGELEHITIFPFFVSVRAFLPLKSS